MILCIVDTSVLWGQLLLCHFGSLFESHIFRISSLISFDYLNYIFLKGVSIVTQMIKAYVNVIEKNESIMNWQEPMFGTEVCIVFLRRIKMLILK